jgi:hypothetical protein
MAPKDTWGGSFSRRAYAALREDSKKRPLQGNTMHGQSGLDDVVLNHKREVKYHE